MMEGSVFLPLPEGLCITEISHDETGLLIKVLSEQADACCPLCSQKSDAVHSRSQRRLKDVPSGGQAVRLSLTVRKFFCHTPECKRNIFTERLPTFVVPWAQMTLRLVAILQAIGLSTSGSLGARLAHRLGVKTSWMTILRRIMKLATPAATTVTVLGVDDFSFKRGRRFGTILVDLIAHQVIDLLPERAVESAAAWIKNHPEIEYVSRDRGNDYAQAAREGPPQAMPVADRFHVYKNLVEAIEPITATPGTIGDQSRTLRLHDPIAEARHSARRDRSATRGHEANHPKLEQARLMPREQTETQAAKSLRSLHGLRAQEVEGRVQKRLSSLSRDQREGISWNRSTALSLSSNAQAGENRAACTPSALACFGSRSCVAHRSSL